VRLVWEVDSNARAVHVYTTLSLRVALLTETDALDGGGVARGRLPFAILFAELAWQG
jgi:hypothetical protein